MPAGQAHGSRRHRVVAVVRAGKREFALADQRCLVPPQLPGSSRHLRGRIGPEAHPSGAAAEILDPQARRGDGHVVVALLGEDAQLCRHVVVKGAVPVQMIGLEIEQHGSFGGERLGVLELKRGCFADDRGLGVYFADQ